MGAMKEVATALEEIGIVGIAAYRSELDGAAVVDLDTADAVGHVRVTLNDGIIWDSDPEQDVPAMLDRFVITHDWGEAEHMECLDCGAMASTPCDGRRLREYVADAKAHSSSCEKGERS